MLSRDAYDRWWRDNVDSNGELVPLPEPAATLAAHIQALQGRIDELPHPDDHDRAHGAGCRCHAVCCGCAYDHPNVLCMSHQEANRG